MAKQTGIGTVVTCDDPSGTARDISADVESLDIDGSATPLDYSGVDATMDQTLVGRGKGTINLVLLFDPGANQAHAVFSAGLGVARTVSIEFKDSGGSTTATYGGEFLPLGYKVSRAANGKMSGPVTLVTAPGSTPAWS